MKAKTVLITLAVVILLFAGILQIALWNSSGSIIDFIAGQFEPSPRLEERDVSVTGGRQTAVRVTVAVDTRSPLNVVDEEYLSFAIDMSQVVGGKWWNPRADVIEMGGGEKHAPVFDFDRPRLDLLAAALAPAYLRIGGTEADKTYYDLAAPWTARIDPPEGYGSAMTRGQWDGVNAFASRNGLKLVFTINTGPATRRDGGSWDPRNAEKLIAYTAWKGYRVSVWELGNELNLFWYDNGPKSMVPPERYHADLVAARALVKKYFPGSRFTGHSSAFWPVLGEPLSFFFGMMEGYVKTSGDVIDIISWHYYPQQSRRGPIATRKAYPSRLLDPDALDEAAHWARYIGGLRDTHAKGRPIWLGESGNAQFGGEPGVSDAYIGGLWWLDQLGLLARNGHKVVVRQTLCGMNYGMIDDETLKPNPDYWNSLLWKRLMGRKAYDVRAEGDEARKVRVYAHSAAGTRDAGVAVLVINLHHDRSAEVAFPGMKGMSYKVYALNGPDVLGKEVLLNGKKLDVVGGRALPPTPGSGAAGKGETAITVKPLSYTFVVFGGKG